MKKAILLVFFAAVSLANYAQNWVEVGVDTAWSTKFSATDLEFINGQTVLLAGYMLNQEGPLFYGHQGFFLSNDAGLSWDTLHFLRNGGYTGENTKIAIFDTTVLLIEGKPAIANGPVPAPPIASGYELNLYNNRLGKLQYLSDYTQIENHIEDVTFISSSTILLTKRAAYGTTNYYFDYPQMMDINTLQRDSIPLPVYIEFINDIHFVDSIRGYMACGSIYQERSGYILITQDGGRTWTVWTDNSSSMYRCIEFYNRNDGITSSGQGQVFFTRNAGFDWFPANGISTRFRAYDICRAGDNGAYAIGINSFFQNGLNESYTQVYKSSDQGASWCLVYEDTVFNNMGSNMHISFANENQGVAAYGYNRLIYTENGGGLTECVTGIGDTPSGPAISIYPNPSNGSFTIALPTTGEHVDITVTDISGKAVLTTSTHSSSLPIEGLGSGVYLVRVQSVSQVYVHKVVVAQ